MAIYTGTLTDVGVNSLGPLLPRLTVRPEIAAWGPDGLVTDNRVVVPLTGVAFSMALIPSSSLVGADGRLGVKYVLEVVLFAETVDGSRAQVWRSEWRFAALPMGGPIVDMGDVPPIAFFVGPPWPATPLPGGYYDTDTGNLGKYAIGE